MHSPLCPSCGYDFEVNAPIVSGEWVISPMHTAYRGRFLDLCPQETMLLHGIAKAGGEWVKREALLNRITDDTENDNLLSVVACHVRRKLGRVGAPVPFLSGTRRGMRWIAGTPAALAPIDPEATPVHEDANG